MKTALIIYLIVLLVMSIFTFLAYYKDKKSSLKGKWRIKENTLFVLALLGGSIGALLGMYQLRHKTKHWYFYLVNWGSLIIQISIAVIIIKYA